MKRRRGTYPRIVSAPAPARFFGTSLRPLPRKLLCQDFTSRNVLETTHVIDVHVIANICKICRFSCTVPTEHVICSADCSMCCCDNPEDSLESTREDLKHPRPRSLCFASHHWILEAECSKPCPHVKNRMISSTTIFVFERARISAYTEPQNYGAP